MRLAYGTHAAIGLGVALGLALPGAAAGQVASFSVSPSAPLTLEPVTFRSTSTGDIDSHAWDLDGDGAFDDGSATSASRSFPIAGVFAIRLRVSGPGGSGEQTRNVRVANRAPAASLGWFPDAPVAGQQLNLVSTAQDPDGRVVSELWDLDGDGAFDDAAGPSVTWAFGAAGAHTVRLRATDDMGASSEAERAVLVGERTFPLLSPFPTVRLNGTLTRRGTLVKRLTVVAPPGCTILVRCNGPGCRRKAQRRQVAGASRTLRFRRFERRLRPRAMLRVYVTKPGTIGKYSRFWFRRGRAPARRDLCLDAETGKPVRCPA